MKLVKTPEATFLGPGNSINKILHDGKGRDRPNTADISVAKRGSTIVTILIHFFPFKETRSGSSNELSEDSRFARRPTTSVWLTGVSYVSAYILS